MVTDFYNKTLVKNNDLVGIANGAQAVGNNHNRSVFKSINSKHLRFSAR